MLSKQNILSKIFLFTDMIIERRILNKNPKLFSQIKDRAFLGCCSIVASNDRNRNRERFRSSIHWQMWWIERSIRWEDFNRLCGIVPRYCVSRADRRTFDGGVQFISANTVLRVPVKHIGLPSHCISQIHGPPFITRFMARHRAAATFAVETHPSWCAVLVVN